MKLLNRVKFATVTTGTDDIVVGAATDGFITPAIAGAANGDRLPYFIVDGANFAYGLGTYSTTGPTLARDASEMRWNGSDLAAAKLSLSGNAEVFVTPRATDLESFGLTQTWQNVLPSRAINTSYHNVTGKPIQVSIRGQNNSNDNASVFQISIDNSVWVDISTAQFLENSGYAPLRVFAVIPPGSYYRVVRAGAGTINIWAELR